MGHCRQSQLELRFFFGVLSQNILDCNLGTVFDLFRDFLVLWSLSGFWAFFGCYVPLELSHSSRIFFVCMAELLYWACFTLPFVFPIVALSYGCLPFCENSRWQKVLLTCVWTLVAKSHWLLYQSSGDRSYSAGVMVAVYIWIPVCVFFAINSLT